MDLSALIKTWNSEKKNATPHVKMVLSFIERLSSCFINDPEQNEFRLLRNTTLAYVLKLLPRVMKVEVLRNDYGGLILSLTSALLEIGDIANISCLKEFFVLCLKFGIGHVDEILSPVCIRVSRFIVTKLYTLGRTSLVDHLFSIDRIHNMVWSHSNFDNIAELRCETRDEIICLLITCASRSDTQLGLDEKKFAKLLAGFNASMSKCDGLLRRLMKLYELNNEFHTVSWKQDDH